MTLYTEEKRTFLHESALGTNQVLQLQMSMLKLVKHGKESHPLAVDALIYKRYMDDIVDANVLVKTRK